MAGLESIRSNDLCAPSCIQLLFLAGAPVVDVYTSVRKTARRKNVWMKAFFLVRDAAVSSQCNFCRCVISVVL